ncbi:MAG TPA: GNAT family N-acetyltransferase [Ilumatobacteraceae bacterium]|nr:GNAT family N-acetyltransferase [Ilumatobacteraceae bacterium]
MQVADERNSPTPRARAPFLLHGSVTCRVQHWSYRPTTAHLVLYVQRATPTVADLQRWCHDLAALGYTHVRSSAVQGATVASLEAAGFHVLQDLALLAHDDVAGAARHWGRRAGDTRRLLVTDRRAASRVDLAAFGRDWALDDTALHEVCSATPRHRARGAGDPLLGYAITGRDGRQGFLQRLAVAPAAQRQGLGLALVVDSLRWMARWRVERALVNTPVDNQGALALYERVGYHVLGERLRVFERSLA